MDAEGQKGKSAALSLSILVRTSDSRDRISAVILVPDAGLAGKVHSEFKRLGKPHKVSAVLLAEERNLKAEEGLLERNPNVIIGTPGRLIIHIRRGHCDFSRLEVLAVQALEIDSSPGFLEDIQFIASKLPRRRQTIILASQDLVRRWEESLLRTAGIVLRRPRILKDIGREVAVDTRSGAERIKEKIKQETDNVSDKKGQDLSQWQNAEEAIVEILKKIREDENPEELNAFRRLIRKNVPIFLRTYLAAYLLKRLIDRIEKTPSAFTTLFISMGKNRKVFPRDLVNLFMREVNIRREDIGEIKVLDNYSFLDISLDHASEAISRLSGKNFRGRRIAVNLARKKKEGRE